MGIAIPLNAVLALIAAVLWGGGDFTGGMGVKGAGGSMSAALRVVIMSHATSLCVLIAIGLLRSDPFPHGAPLAWAIGAGLMGGSSVCIFYIALSRGAMGASAAVSGLLAAAIPALVSVGVDGAPGTQHLLGFLLAGAAIWLIAAAPGENTDRGTMSLAIVSGAGFGLYFVALKFAGVAGIVWPMAAARSTSVVFCSTALLVLIAFEKRSGKRARVRISRNTLLWALGTAIMDTSGNMFFVGATRVGRLDVASVLASLYPATTILLAAWTLHERPTRRQGLGMGLAAAAVVLITL
ncbi:DMT family transporter [Granulicella sibirica]|uniref:EamA domain-containing protein n=1 Tax=Granulicella sibirica TaxID=2479048 RepID=A0A4Q0T1U9_9BACT|nr:DMT family transporter [Granulicella sibirica]RXH57625.1 hypothetical protein GRAN_0935 [Granulicella sibirica]